MSKIKVLRIIARLNIGGPAIHTILLGEGLNKDDFETLLVVGRPDENEGDMSYLVKDKSLKIEYIKEIGREIGGSDFIAFVKLLRLIWSYKPDIVHTHTAKAGTLGRLAAILTGVPVKVHTFHGHVFHSYFGKLKTKIFILIERLLGVFTDFIITISDAQKEEISNIYKIVPAKKIKVIKLGFNLDFFLKDTPRGAVRKEFGLPDNCIVIGIVGRLVEVKDHKLFFDSAKVLLDEVKDKEIFFLVVGDGKLKDNLEKYCINLGIEKNALFLGWRRDLDFIYKDMDIVALTSLNEGTPVSLIEASSSGKPIVTMDVGGVRDIVKDGESGYLVKKRDKLEFSRNLAILVKDPALRTKMGEAGRRFIKENYSKERLISEIESLYREALGRK